MDLERALHALRVAGREARGRARIDARELGVQRRIAVARGFGGERGTHLRVGRRHRIEAVEQRLEVEHRAADQQRQPAARADVTDQAARVGDEARRGIRIGWLDDVDQVVRDRGAFGRARASRCRCPCRDRPAPNRR